MTLEELFFSVMALGFESEGEISTDFIFAANRAQRMIFSELSDELIARVNADTLPVTDDFKEIDLASHISDVDSFTHAPESPSGAPIPGARIIGGVLIIPKATAGNIILRYKRVPKGIGIDSPSEAIDIPRRAEYLLPVLTAAFFWLDDDEEKAAYYMSIYKTEAARLKSCGTPLSAAYYDTTGWA